jgi:hypothetical protein
MSGETLYPWDFRAGYTLSAGQRHESEKQHQAFLRYAQLGPKRSTTTVAAEISTHPVSVRRWASQYRWRDRAAALDAYAHDGIAPPPVVAITKLLAQRAEQAAEQQAKADAEAAQVAQQLQQAEQRRSAIRPGGIASPTPLDDLEEAQAKHIKRLTDLQHRAEVTGRNLLAMSARYLALASELTAEHEARRVNPRAPKPYASLETAMRLTACAAQISGTGITHVANALGVDQIAQELEAIKANDARALVLESADPGDLVVEPLPAEPEEAS